MLNFIKKLTRIYAGLHSAWPFVWRCFLLVTRAQFRKPDRDKTNQSLHQGSIKILNNIKARYKISYTANFKMMGDVPRIYMSNHLSLYDTPLFFATIPDTIRIVTKKELTRVPLIGKAILYSENAIVDRQAGPGNNFDFFADAKKKLLDGIALWIFPEGTRSRQGEMLPFRSGGFRLATEVGAQIIPVGIIGTDKILPAGKIIPHMGQDIEIRLGQVIDASEYNTPELQKELLKRVNLTIRELIQSPKPLEKIAAPVREEVPA